MHPIIQKTIGGLSFQYYFRQFLFGSLFCIFYLYLFSQGWQKVPQISLLILAILNTLLYPYSRFVYESIVNFILGNNVFWGNAIVILAFKIFTMLLCWSFAIFVAPIGFIYLYFHHSKKC
jgi:hypothetical protein